MKKRILSLMLAPILLFSMAVPAIAAERGDSADRLAAVTGKVKSALALDTERYTQFNGQLTEGELAPTWHLTWSGDGSSLEINASESGRILSYYRYDDGESWDNDSLSLPKGDPAKAQKAAAAFLAKVLDASETVDLDAASQNNSARQTRYFFRGTLLLNGCPSPLSFNLSVRASDYTVTQFYRDSTETEYIGTIPAADFHTDPSAAGALLGDTLSMRLEYVLDEGKSSAVLRYLPNSTHSFYVDDAAKKLVDLTELYEALGKGENNSAEALMADAEATAGSANRYEAGLTQAEQLGADKLKDTLDKDGLDQKARAISQLGLKDYTLASASYQEQKLDGDESIITARLTYSKQTGEHILRRWVILNAKTGELLSVSSSSLWEDNEDAAVREDAARKTAEAFLSEQQGERFALCAAYTSGSDSQMENGRWNFQYARKVNGYFFPNDQFTVSIDAKDGSVASYSQSWSENVSFASPDGIISASDAVNAYFKTFQITGGYVAVPQKLDLSDPEFAPLAEMGYRALNSLKLGWQLEASEDDVIGIDAKTGKPVLSTSKESDSLSYSDLSGSWAKSAVETLAEYGIGYAGGKFRTDKQLTQLELVALLASTQGRLIDPDNLADGEADQAYRSAYGMGALRREDRDDDRLLTRIDVIKILLDAGGYGPAARLQGIYRTDFSDEEAIPEGMLGYAALAQAMKVAQGDSGQRLNPTQSSTRGEAAVMLLAFMQRD